MDSQIKDLSKVSANTFRFSNQHEKLSAVAITRVSAITETLNECHFQDMLIHWSDLNCTAAYTLLKKGLNPLTSSLEGILLHQQEILELLLANLSPDAMEPSLNLITSLSMDLLEEFHPNFPRVITALVDSILQYEVRLITSLQN